jgi:hypothetical protein
VVSTSCRGAINMKAIMLRAHLKLRKPSMRHTPLKNLKIFHLRRNCATMPLSAIPPPYVCMSGMGAWQLQHSSLASQLSVLVTVICDCYTGISRPSSAGNLGAFTVTSPPAERRLKAVLHAIERSEDSRANPSSIAQSMLLFVR